MMNHHLGYDQKSNRSWLLMQHFSNPTCQAIFDFDSKFHKTCVRKLDAK